MNTKEDIRDYWNKRAKEQPNSATTNDVMLREKEKLTILAELDKLKFRGNFSILDIGCGDGWLTKGIAAAFENATVTGIDNSSEMLKLANRPPKLYNVEYKEVDLLDYLRDNDQSYDVIVGTRVIINLPNTDTQIEAFKLIQNCLNQGGVYLGTENFISGQDNMNSLRKGVGLSEIPIQGHNLYLCWTPKDVKVIDAFSAYYYATRVLYSKMCKMSGLEPNYLHPLHVAAVDLPPLNINCSPVQFLKYEKPA